MKVASRSEAGVHWKVRSHNRSFVLLQKAIAAAVLPLPPVPVLPPRPVLPPLPLLPPLPVLLAPPEPVVVLVAQTSAQLFWAYGSMMKSAHATASSWLWHTLSAAMF